MKMLAGLTIVGRAKYAVLLLMLFQPAALAGSGDTGSIKIPISLESDIVLVPVRLAPKGRVFSFLLDTGAELTAVDPKIAAELHLQPGEDVDVLTVGEGHKVPTVRLNQLQIGSLRIPPLQAASYDLGALAEALESRVDGVLGVDILSRFPFTIDFTRKEVTIWKSGQVPQLYKRSRSTLRPGKGGYLVPVLISGVFRCELLLDSGTNLTQLPRNMWQRLLVVWHPHKMLAGVSSTGQKQASSYLVRLESLVIGNFKLAKPVVRFVQDIPRGTFGEPDAPGLLGTDILRQFIVTVDIPHQRIFFVRDKGYKADPLAAC